MRGQLFKQARSDDRCLDISYGYECRLSAAVGIPVTPP